MIKRNVILSVAALAATLAGSRAYAQPLRPNIMIIFDTSTSMGMNAENAASSTVKDGSALCGGVGNGDNMPNDGSDFTRRIYALKNALRGTLAEVGTDEANFGLMRFPQLEDPALASVTCPGGHYIVNNSLSTMDGAQELTGCRMSTQNMTTPETTFGPWFTQDVGGKPAFRQSIIVDVTKPFGATGPVAGDFDPAGGNIAAIYQWLDGNESVSGGAITDPELRTPLGARTPLGRSLLYARLYFQNFIKKQNAGNYVDPKGACRKNIVILVTDGAESCDSTGALRPEPQAAQLLAAGVETYVVTDTNVCASSTNCGTNDSIAFYGDPKATNKRKAIQVDLTNQGAVKSALLQIIAEAVPPIEICNGVDDNCNGDIDNQMGKDGPLPDEGGVCDCGGAVTDAMVGNGKCMKGKWVCRLSDKLKCEGCVLPGTEICNGEDDNCNGKVDEGFDLGKPCTNGLKGVCERFGTTVCSPDGSAAICDAPTVAGTAEICNGLDDDCDGMVDEPDMPGGNLPGEGGVCGNSLGECKAGKLVCERTAGSAMLGQFVCKDEQTAGDKEICDLKDNDCNGQTDEGLPDVGKMCACKDAPNAPIKFNVVTDADVLNPANIAKYSVGECKPGALVCKGREPLDCDGCIGPRNESCNFKDDNCDGMTDEGDMICGISRICVANPAEMTAKCELKCNDGEFPCPVGFDCTDSPKGRYCRSSLCNNVTCKPEEDCNMESGACENRCTGVTCPAAGQSCSHGKCVDCYTTGCKTGELCLAGVCQKNPCATQTCGPTEACQNGACVGVCAEGCPAGQRCSAGTCQPDLCAAQSCTSICDPTDGQCKSDNCLLRSCSSGKRCVKVTGTCKDDPCATTFCPTCFKCEMDEAGNAGCTRDAAACGPEPAPPTKRFIKIGKSGCDCSLGAEGHGEIPGLALLPLFGWFALHLGRRRSRRTR